jgi:hypothetical protein
MKIFLLLNGMGVIFLLYVLLQFWKEGRRSKHAVPPRRAIEVPYKDRTKIVIVTRPISNGAQADGSLASFQRSERSLDDAQARRETADRTREMPMKGHFAR